MVAGIHGKARLGGLVAAASVVALAVASCSSGGGPGESAKAITVYTTVNSQQAEKQKKWFADVSNEFKKQTGASVKFETYSSNNAELTTIQTSVISSSGPDIYDIGTTFTPTAYATGAFDTLTDADWSAIGGKDKFVPSSLDSSGPNSSDQIGVPWSSKPYVLAYNTDLLKQAGISAPADSWDGLAAQAKKLTGRGVYGMAVAYKDDTVPWKFIWAMDSQAGNPIVKGKSVTIDDPTTLTAYETYFGWLTKDKVVDPASVGWSQSQATAAFASGKAAFLPMTSSTSASTFDSSAIKGKYKFAVMPTIPPGESARPRDGVPAASLLAGENLVVAKYSPNQDLDFKLIKLLTDPEEQQTLFDDFGQLSTNQQTAEQIAAKNPGLAPVVEAGSRSNATPFNGAWANVELDLGNVVVQEIPALSEGTISEAKLKSLLAAAQKSAQSSVGRTK